MPDARYRLFCRASGCYYQQDNETGVQASLRTQDKRVALEKLRAANQAATQLRLSLKLAPRVHLKARETVKCSIAPGAT